MGVDDAWVSPLHVERSANNERITRCASLSFNYVCRLNDVGDEQEIWNVFFCLRCCSRFRWNCYVCEHKPWATTSTSQSRYIYNHLFIYIYISVVIHQCCVWDTQCPTNSFGTNVKRLSVVYLYIYISFFFPSRTHLKYEFKTVYSHRQKRLIDHIICWVVTFSFFPFFFFYSTLQNSYRHKNQNREEETLSYAFKCVAVYRMEDSGCRISPPNVNDLWSFLSRMKWSGHKTWSDTISA